MAFLLEPKDRLNATSDLIESLELLADVERSKGTATSLKRSEDFERWIQAIANGAPPKRASLCTALTGVINRLAEGPFVGDPRRDWQTVRGFLRDTANGYLLGIDNSLHYLMAFNRGYRIAALLADAWLVHQQYVGARRVLDAALAQEQLLGGGDTASGIQVMTMHKSKGKQFDGVIILRADHFSPFVWRNDPPPHRRSRRILRVAITRARYQVLILDQANSVCPVLDER